MASIITFIFLSGCTAISQSNNHSFMGLDWSINTRFVLNGCPGKDCIPSLEHPNRSTVEGDYLAFLDDNELVVGVRNGNDWTAYPHSVLDWHEIVNENGYAISYCPLTGSALHIETTREFGVSGLLYNSNLIMYDRETDSRWPQMHLASAAGELKGTAIKLQPLLETTWKNWRKLFPETKVINSQTGYSRNYDFYPYGRYRTCNSTFCRDYIFFPIAYTDNRLKAKDRVLALIGKDGSAKAFRISQFNKPIIIQGLLDGEQFNAVISGEDNLAIAFSTDKNLYIETWDIENGDITLTSRSTGQSYDILGNPKDGAGDKLTAGNGFIAYWFSVAAFYPNTELYQ
ncbi:MAG: DUF3179 domain-containing protein [Candidatus Marinimicrobia bacterium]|nr:DUF3179 domain-containing protein [Candidatus Neomarinimicrobiota bacterium]